MIAKGQGDNASTSIAVTQDNVAYRNSEATRSAMLTATPAALAAEATSLALDHLRATDAKQSTHEAATSTSAPPAQTHEVQTTRLSSILTQDVGLGQVHAVWTQQVLDGANRISDNRLRNTSLTCVASLGILVLFFGAIFLIVHLGRDSIRVWADATDLLMKRLALNRETVAKARLMEANMVYRQAPGQEAVMPPSLPGREFSPETYRVLHVVSKMCDILGRPSAKVPSARLRVSKGLSNTIAQPVINVLVEDGILRAHVDGEDQGMYVNKGVNLGGLEALIEGGVFDWTGDDRLKREEDVSLELTTS
jgi:hypothetical protein